MLPEEDVLGSDGESDDTMEEPRSGGMRGDTTVAGAAGMVAIDESSREPT